MNDAKIALQNRLKNQKSVYLPIFLDFVVYLSQLIWYSLKNSVFINFFAPFISNLQAEINVISIGQWVFYIVFQKK